MNPDSVKDVTSSTTIPTNVVARVEKPPIPTLWLDSFVGINLAKLANGESIPSERAEPLKRLREVVIRKTLARNLLCVEGDQDNEYARERLDEEVAGEFARLTLGIQLSPGLAIADKQIFCGMDALVSEAGEVVIPWRTFFGQDPIEALAATEELGFFIRMGPPGSPVVKDLKTSRHGQAEEFERWRKENVKAKRTFEDQLKAELLADASALIKQTAERISRLRRGEPLTLDDVLVMSGDGSRQAHWERIGGRPEGMAGVIRYYQSPQHAAIPANGVAAVLWADILTGEEVVRPGDPGDVDLLPHALAVSHFVLTDVRARRRVQRRGLDTELGVKVFSERELPELISALESLGAK